MSPDNIRGILYPAQPYRLFDRQAVYGIDFLAGKRCFYGGAYYLKGIFSDFINELCSPGCQLVCSLYRPDASLYSSRRNSYVIIANEQPDRANKNTNKQKWMYNTASCKRRFLYLFVSGISNFNYYNRETIETFSLCLF